MARTKREVSITGRDNYIRNQALLYAIAHIQSLPEAKQEFSNMCDMCALALEPSSPFTVGQVLGVELHTGQTINLWPLEDEVYTAEQLSQKAQFTAFVSHMRKSLLAVSVLNGISTSTDPEVIEIVEAFNAGKGIHIYGKAA